MSPDAISGTLPSLTPTASLATPRPRATRALTRRATANALAALLDYGARIGAGLVVTPILVRALGPSLFGSWEMLLRFGSYVSATDGRPSEALRLVVAQSRAVDDSTAQRRLVGASLVVWCLMMPVVAGLGVVLVYASPRLVGAGPEYAIAIRIAAACLAGTTLVGSLAAVPESVLRGMNLGHTRMGYQAALHVVGGALSVGAVWIGLGLAGLGGALLARSVITGLCFWWLVNRSVPWFSAARPSREEVRRMFGMSAWLMLGDLIAKLNLRSDVLLLGALLDPRAVAVYVLTGYAARVAIGVHVFTVGEAVPGIGALLGHGEFARVRAARRELLLLTWLFVTLFGGVLLLWNRAFVSHWVGGAMYAGSLVDCLIVLAAAQTAFIRVDAGIIDAALRPRARVMVGAGAAVATLTLGFFFTRRWGMPGLAVAILLGRSVQSLGYPLLAARALRPAAEEAAERRSAWVAATRALATSLLVGAAAVVLAPRITAGSWATFAAGVGVSAVPIALVTLGFGASAELRRSLVDRVRLLRGASR